MAKKTNHAYSTSTSGSANALRPEVGTDQGQGRTMRAAFVFTGGTLALALAVTLASFGLSMQSVAGAKEKYIRAAARGKYI